MKATWKIAAIISIIVASLLSYGVYYSQGLKIERNVVTTVLSYEQSISHNYTAYLKNNTLFGETAGKGDTLYRELVNFIDVSFYYAFNCSEEGQIEFDYVVSSVVEEPSENGWSKSIDVSVSVKEMRQRMFTENLSHEGVIVRAPQKDRVLGMTFSYNITEISEIIEKIEEETGYSSMSYQVVTSIDINLTDETSFEMISESLEESVVLKLGYRVVEVEASDKRLMDSITENHVETIDSAVNMRSGTILALAAWIVAGSGFTAKKYREGKAEYEETPEVERVMGRLEVVESVDTPDLKVQTLSSIGDLEKIAEEWSSIIFHSRRGGEDVFFITENNILYQYISEKAESS
jgi:hypothetical protein